MVLLLAPFVRKHRHIEEFWQFIKTNLPSYAKRRAFIWPQFCPALWRSTVPLGIHKRKLLQPPAQFRS